MKACFLIYNALRGFHAREAGESSAENSQSQLRKRILLVAFVALCMIRQDVGLDTPKD